MPFCPKITRPELQRNAVSMSHLSSIIRATEPRVGDANSLSISPLIMSSDTTLGLRPSTWQPTLNAVPKISRTVPWSSLANDLERICRAISMTSSNEIDLLCLMFFSFFRSRGGSLSALMISDDAVGTTETVAWRFWIVSLTVTRRPFYNGGT